MVMLTVISAKRSKSATPPYKLGRQPDLRPPDRDTDHGPKGLCQL